MLQVCGKHNIFCYSTDISYTMRCATTLILVFYLSSIYARPQVPQNLKDVDSNSFAKNKGSLPNQQLADEKLTSPEKQKETFTRPNYPNVLSTHFGQSEKESTGARKTQYPFGNLVSPPSVNGDKTNDAEILGYSKPEKNAHHQNTLNPNLINQYYMDPFKSQVVSNYNNPFGNANFGPQPNSNVHPVLVQQFVYSVYRADIPNWQSELFSSKNSNVQPTIVISNVYGLLPNDLNGQISNLNTQNLPDGATSQNTVSARQMWNWPGANLFPIYIRDPFLQFYYALTNMVEMGPNSGTDGPCKLTPRPQPSRIKNILTGISNNNHQKQDELGVKKPTEIVKKTGLSNNSDLVKYLNIEDIDISADELINLTINPAEPNFPTGRELKLVTKTNSSISTSGKLDFVSNINNVKQSQPVSGPLYYVDEVEDEALEKAEDISVSNKDTKKIFSRENTGNGIFINKLKVRQGGVAIAGPGGIATAGSGGTAIVGPDGVAYTHPNGLAIVGSGTKVVAVNPDIDLGQVVRESILNGTQHIPNERHGKVVAVGPVIYYNQG